jgi:hypothetical protein
MKRDKKYVNGRGDKAKVMGTLLCAALVTCHLSLVTSCTDTWDDHYDGTIEGVHEGSLWKAIQQDATLSNFASVIEATGFDRSLGSSQVFSVFAPVNDNFSKQQADELIAQYKKEKQTVSDDDNTVIKEFVKNHIALYNHSVSSLTNDTITLMNGKYAFLSTTKIDNATFKTANDVYENGVLYTLTTPVNYSANIFEQIRKDADLDSVRSFLYNPYFYRKTFDAESSIEGGLNELGQTTYLDSVWRQENELYTYIGKIASEDSVFWMTAPTNEQWDSLVKQYTPYFQYADNVGSLLTRGNVDSLFYTAPRMAIMRGTVFSQTVNKRILSRQVTEANPLDSVFSVNAPLSYADRSFFWGSNFNYYQYFGPLLPGKGVLAEPDSTKCSNGVLLKSRDWKIDQLQTFNQWIVIEAEGSNSVEIEKYAAKVTEKDGKKDTTWAYTTNANYRSVINDKYKGKVWNNRFVTFTPNDVDPIVCFNITDVLSNMGYDIYLVTVPEEAADSTVENLRTRFNAYLQWTDASGKEQTQQVPAKAAIQTEGNIIEYLLLPEDFKFPVCTYGINEAKPSIRLRLVNSVPQSMINRGTHSKTMNIDCLLLVPHGTLQLIEDMGEVVSPQLQGQPGVLMYPHGDNLKYYYMFR